MKFRINRPMFGVTALLLGLSILSAACSSSTEQADASQPFAELTITDAWVRSDLDPTAVYLTIHNPGLNPVNVSGVEATWTGEIAMHQTVQLDGLMVMEHLMSMSVPAGGSLSFEPGGLHIMAQDLHSSIAEGDSLQLALVTDSGERFQFTAIARGILGIAPDADHVHEDDDHEMTEHGDDADVEAHGVVFSSGTIPPGKSFEFTFDHAFEGVMVPYHNHLNGASGSVMVTDGASESGAVRVTIDENGYHPAELHIAPGTVVTWTNETDVAWTVINGYHPDSR